MVFNWHSKAPPAVVRSHWGSLNRDPKIGYNSGDFPFAAFELLRADKSAFSSVFAFKGIGRLNVLIAGRLDLAVGQYVSGEFFSGLGVRPAAGRLIDASDERAGAPPVVVLGFGYAQRRFGHVSDAVGQSIRINNTPFVIAGVAASEFFGVNPEAQQDFYLPFHADTLVETAVRRDIHSRYFDNYNYWIDLMGRLKSGLSMSQAEVMVAPQFARLVESTATSAEERMDLPVLYLQEGAGGLDFLRRQYSKPLYVLMTMVGLILAIACANIANLLLARAAVRRRELAVRLSLGAGRLRLVRQLLTESLLLASIGGLSGLVLARWGIQALTLLIANGRENFTLHANLNWRVLGVTMGLSVVTGTLFGLAPAVQSIRLDLISRLRQTRVGEQTLHRPSGLRISLTQVLVVAQIAISLVLLIAAGLFLRTLANLNSTVLGFNSDRVLLFNVNPRQAGYDSDALIRFYEILHSRFSTIPGVRSVTASNFPLISGSQGYSGVTVPGFTGKNSSASVLYVGRDFFTTMEIPLLLGRQVDERDVRAKARVVVVNEVFAKTFFSGQHPIGRHFQLGGDDLEIIGIVKNARYSSLKQEIPPVCYIPYSQSLRFTGQMTYELRAAGDPLALSESVRRMVSQADPRIPVSNIVTQAKRIDQTISQERTFATLCTCFAVLALFIACVGLYGTMAYSVTRRTNEIGIRVALGARRGQLIWMVLREVLAMGVTGLGIGLVAATATSHLVQSFLFQMKPNDPLALALAGMTLLLATIVAGFIPASAASRTDPWTALRDE